MCKGNHSSKYRLFQCYCFYETYHVKASICFINYMASAVVYDRRFYLSLSYSTNWKSDSVSISASPSIVFCDYEIEANIMDFIIDTIK